MAFNIAKGRPHGGGLSHTWAGHPGDGYFNPTRQCAEAWAEMMSSQIADPDAWSLIERCFPQSVTMFNTYGEGGDMPMKDADFEAFCKEAKDIPLSDLSTAYFRSQGVGFFNIEDNSINVTGKELQRWMLWCVYYGRPKEEYPLAMNQ